MRIWASTGQAEQVHTVHIQQVVGGGWGYSTGRASAGAGKSACAAPPGRLPPIPEKRLSPLPGGAASRGGPSCEAMRILAVTASTRKSLEKSCDAANGKLPDTMSPSYFRA